MTWAVFMDRYNTCWREADGFATEEEAKAEADRRHATTGWYHYVGPSDWDPAADMYNMYEMAFMDTVSSYLSQGMTEDEALHRAHTDFGQ